MHACTTDQHFTCRSNKSCKKSCQKVEKISTNDSNICQTFENKSFYTFQKTITNTRKNCCQLHEKSIAKHVQKICCQALERKTLPNDQKKNFLTDVWIKVTYNLKIYDESSKKTWFSV